MRRVNRVRPEVRVLSDRPGRRVRPDQKETPVRPVRRVRLGHRVRRYRARPAEPEQEESAAIGDLPALPVDWVRPDTLERLGLLVRRGIPVLQDVPVTRELEGPLVLWERRVRPASRASPDHTARLEPPELLARSGTQVLQVQLVRLGSHCQVRPLLGLQDQLAVWEELEQRVRLGLVPSGCLVQVVIQV